MLPKLIVTDLDETLLKTGGAVSERTKKAIRAVRERGIIFTACTGRMFESAMNHVRDLDLDDLIICANGALVRRISVKDYLLHQPLSEQKYQQLLKIAQERNWNVVACANDEMFCDRWIPWLVKYRDKYINDVNNAVKINVTGANFFEGNLSPEKVLFIVDAPEAYEAQRVLREICSEHYDVAISKPPCIEIMDKTATKGKALKWLAEYLGINREEVVAFGDSFNDIDMIEYAGTGVAMANAISELQNCADAHTASNNDDGVAAYLEEFVLR